MLQIRVIGEVGELGLITCVWSGIDQAARQTPSSERVLQGIDTNVLCGREVTLEPWMRKHWVKRGATGTEWTWRRATTSETQDVNERAGWLWLTRTRLDLEPRSPQCVLTRESVPSRSVSGVWRDAKVQRIWRKFLDHGQKSRILSWTFYRSILFKFPWASLYFRNCFIDSTTSGLITYRPVSCVVAILSKSKTTHLNSNKMLKTIEKKKMRLGNRVLLRSTFPNLCSAIPSTREF